MKISGSSLLAGVSALAMLTGSAIAQAPDPAPAAEEASGNEEVIVTSQKRSQNLQKVPITVTALSAKTLNNAGIVDSRNLTLVTPGLNFANATATASPTIRGVATRGIGPGDEPAVPIYIDGVYQSTTHAGFFSFNNVQRIEVLKGPQGTLFGRNAEGGAISVITLTPSFDPILKGDLSYGSDNEHRVNLYGSMGLSDTVAVSLALHADQHDGWIDDLVTGGKKANGKFNGARAKLLWTPAENVEFTLGASWMESSDDSAFSGYPLGGNTIAKRVNPAVLIAGPGQTAVVDTFFEVRQHAVYGNLRYSFDGFDVNLLQSWTKTFSDQLTDSDVSPVSYSFASFPYFDEAYTTELRLTSTGDNTLDWIAGVFYIDDKGQYGTPTNLFQSRSTPTGAVTSLISKIHTSSYSIFGEATYHFTDTLSLTAGLRYTAEDREKDLWRSTTPFASLPNIVPLAYLGHAERSYTNWSGRASLQYDFTDKIHGFVTFSQGFKSGFFNASSGPPFVALEPETLDNYEIGLKTEPSNNLRVNITAFYMNYYDLHASSRSPNQGSTTDVFNAGSASNYGGELSVDWKPTDNWSVTLGVAYQHARYEDFIGAQVYYPSTSTDTAANVCAPGTGTLIGGNRAALCDVAGAPLAKSPDWTVSLQTEYTFEALNGTVDIGGVLYWSDNFTWDLGGLFDNGGSYSIINARATWSNPDDTLSITLFANNLTDSEYPMNRYQAAAATYEQQVRPANFGIKVGFTFE